MYGETLDRYEKVLEEGLLKICQGAGLLDSEILRNQDLDDTWDAYMKEYVADAVENFNGYPEAAVAWAGFLGMAVAFNWDADWRERRYADYYGPHGWDDMDEHVLEEVLGLPLDSAEARKLSGTLQSCALAALGLISHEGIETQTALGFYVLSRTYTVMYRVGAAISLKRLGYRKVKIG